MNRNIFFIAFTILIFFSTQIFAQVPHAFNYQAVVRNADGNIVQNEEVHLQFGIYAGTTIVFSEEHIVTTSNQGIVNLVIGEGSLVSGSFEEIDWSIGDYMLGIKISFDEGTTYNDLGDATLLSVPYALHAKTVENKDDADADPENELQVLSISGDTIYLENGGYVVLPEDEDVDSSNELQTLSIDADTIYLSSGGSVTLPVDDDADPTNEYQTISYENDSLEITNGNKIKLPFTDTTWRLEGNDLFYNEGNVGIGTTTPSSKLIVKGDQLSIENDLLFAVVNNSNDTVFAVFQGGVRIYVDDNPEEKATGNRGGFAVGGFGTSKGITNEYLRITPDSIRLYVNDDISKATGNRGGFAVGGFGTSKGFSKNEYLRVTPDSTRVYVNETSTKGTSGGFAVGEINDEVKNVSGNFLELNSLNSFIGLDAGKSITTGQRNAFIGFQAGMNNTTGFDNVFIGNNSGLENTEGVRNIFVGTNSGQNNTEGFQNIAIGLQAGYELETGRKNVFIGTLAGAENINGDDNVFIGNFAGNASNGNSNVYIGRTTGMNNTDGYGNVFIGEQSGRSNVEGSGNVFIGRGSGQNELGSNRLYISNSYTIYPLIYGEFDNGIVQVNGSIKLTDVLNLKPKSSYPGNPETGDIFFDSNTNSIKYYSGTEWMEITATASIAPPNVKTDSIPELTLYGESCIVYGNVLAQGGSALTEVGVCYSEVPFFDFALNYGTVTTTATEGPFNVTLTGIPQYQDIYIRAYAENSDGIAMGEMIMVTTPITSATPTVESKPVLFIEQTTAMGGGNVTAPGGLELTDRGICWGTDLEPTIGDNTLSDPVTLGEYELEMTGLTAETTYFMRAFATNGNGTAYGEEIQFITAPNITTVSDIEGNEYNLVQIGTQTWIKENLKTRKYNDGSDIPNITDFTEWTEMTTGAYCWYDNDSATHHDTYGLIYNYYAVVNENNLCPTGWHVPTKTDWDDMIEYLGGEDIAGGKLREVGTAHWLDDPGVDNSSGFTALPGGFRFFDSDFGGLGAYSMYYSATEEDDYISTYFILPDEFSITEYASVQNNGFSVRCIKD